jgi:hypothetical protein
MDNCNSSNTTLLCDPVLPTMSQAVEKRRQFIKRIGTVVFIATVVDASRMAFANGACGGNANGGPPDGNCNVKSHGSGAADQNCGQNSGNTPTDKSCNQPQNQTGGVYQDSACGQFPGTNPPYIQPDAACGHQGPGTSGVIPNPDNACGLAGNGDHIHDHQL